jgi:predicted dehydrogenase
VAYAWAELDVSPRDGVTTDQWCRQFGVQRCETLDELCQKSDVILVLAPSEPQTHLRYAEQVLKYGKRTYIDKTFAPDLETARRIFALGEQYNAPFFSTSALRYATELEEYPDCRQIVVTGSGSNLAEYVIHLIEMVVKKLGTGAAAVKAEQIGEQTFLQVRYADDRAASMIYAQRMPYTVYMCDGAIRREKAVYRKVESSFFDGLIERILKFYETGEDDFDGAQTLEVMRLRDGVLRAAEQTDTWLTI